MCYSSSSVGSDSLRTGNEDGTIRTMAVAGREVGAILGRTFLRKEEER